MYTEHDLAKRIMPALKKRLEPRGFIVLKHNDRRTAGIPDISVTGNTFTSWWELKVNGENGIVDTDLKRQLMLKFAMSSFSASYVILHSKLEILTVQNPMRFDKTYPHLGSLAKWSTASLASACRGFAEYVALLHRESNGAAG